MEGASDHRTTAEQLAIEQERASLALSAARMGEFEWEIDEDRLVISPRMAAITGLPAGSIPAERGQAAYRFIHPDDIEEVREAIRTGLGDGGGYEVDYRMIRPDNGLVRWMTSHG